MRILLTGASGFIGGHLTRALQAAGHEIVPVSRRHGMDLTRMTEPAHWRRPLEGVDAVINAAGIIGEHRGQTFEALHTRAPVALFRACASSGVRRVVQISALGADARAFSAYHLSKRAADDALRALPLEGFVLRPALVYGPGGTSAGLFLRLAAAPVVPVPGAGDQTLQPVYVGDVVDVVLRCLTAPATGLSLDLPGPQQMTFADWLRRLRAAQGLPPARIVPVPLGLIRALMPLGRWLNPLAREDNLRMLEAGQDADVRPVEQFLGRALRPATPDLICPPSTSPRRAP